MPEAALPRGYVISFDYGQRRIGVAVGQATTLTATPLEVVANSSQPDWPAIDRLVREWRPECFLVGLPLDSEANETEMSKLARSFGDELTRRYHKACHFHDERLSSRAADERFASMRAAGAARRKDAARLDSLAAQLILENWLQSLAQA